MASGTLNKMRDQKKGSHEKPLLKRSEYLYLVRKTKLKKIANTEKNQVTPSSANLHEYMIVLLLISYFKSDFSL